MDSDIKFDRVDWREAARYLVIMTIPGQQRQMRIRKFMPRRKHNRGSTPSLSGAGITGPNSKVDDQWEFPDVSPGQADIRRLVGAFLSVAVKAIYNTHTYKFNGKTYLQ